MNNYKITMSRWSGGEVRTREMISEAVSADLFEVEKGNDAYGYVAKFYRDHKLVAAYVDFFSVVQLDPDHVDTSWVEE